MRNGFKYFISYKWYGKEKEGFGNIEYTTKRKIDIDLIRIIEKDLVNNHGIEKPVIINYQLF